MAKQFALHVSLQVAPHNVDAFLEALRPCWAGCVAEKENLFFDVFEDLETLGLLRFVEVWSEDKEWFLEVQAKKPYYKPYLDITVPMWIADRQ
jgi:quinol monooxygenase YgiN